MMNACVSVSSFIHVRLLNSDRSQLDLTLEPTMARDSCVFQAIGKFGVAGYPLAANEDMVVGRLCEVGKVALMEFAHDFVRSSDGRPLLYEYVGDATCLLEHVVFQDAQVSRDTLTM